MSIGFPKQESWVVISPPGDLSDPGNLSLLHCKRIFFATDHQGSPQYCWRELKIVLIFFNILQSVDKQVKAVNQVAIMVKNLPSKTWDVRGMGLTPGSGRSPGEGTGTPLQYSCLENSVDRGAWWATFYGVAESDTQKQLSTQHSDPKWLLTAGHLGVDK